MAGSPSLGSKVIKRAFQSSCCSLLSSLFVPVKSVFFSFVLCSFFAGPALILPSPVKPVVLPVSVMGQNTMGSIQVLSNQVT